MIVRSEGAGRLDQRWLETPAGRVAHGLWDRQLGTPCRPATTNDGRVVCAPYEAAGVRFLSADERCERNTVWAPIGDVSEVERALCGTLFSVVGSPATETKPLAHVNYVGRLEPHLGPVYERNGTGNCNQVSSGGSDGPYLTSGTPIPLTDLAPLTRTVDP